MLELNKLNLINYIQLCKKTDQIFLGVFARDELPKVSYPSCFIINNKNKNNVGEHWLAFFYDTNKNCSFFDSYGLPASFYCLNEYIQFTSNTYNSNIIQYQAFNSISCGYFCLLFLYLKSRNISIKQVLSRNTTKNELILEQIFSF